MRSTPLPSEPPASSVSRLGPMPTGTGSSFCRSPSVPASRSAPLRLKPAVVDGHAARTDPFAAAWHITGRTVSPRVAFGLPAEHFAGRELVAFHSGQLGDRRHAPLAVASPAHLNDQPDRADDLLADRPMRQIRTREQHERLEAG